METRQAHLQTGQVSSTYLVPEVGMPNQPDRTSMAGATDGMLDRALAYCAEKMHLTGTGSALDLLRRGDRMARWYAHHSLAEQIAECLGQLDDTIEYVYVYDLDATPEDLAFGEPSRTSPIHMIVRAERKTAAVFSLIRALEDALVQEYAERVGPDKLEFLLDVQVIDIDDVKMRRGYGALLSSLHSRTIEVWHR